MEEIDDDRDRGTSIVLHLSEDCAEYCQKDKVDELLKSTAASCPYLSHSARRPEWKDGKYVDTDRDNIVNDTDPLWTRKPTEITEEQYKEFYRELFTPWATIRCSTYI